MGSEDFLVQRMITRLTGDGGCLEALQAIMDDLIDQEPALKSTEEGEEDVRFWLWDMSVLPAVLRKDGAKRLLWHAEVLKAEVVFFPDSDSSTAASSRESAGPKQWRRCKSLGV